MEKSYSVLKKSIDSVGIKKVAAELNLSTAMIYKWCQEAPTDDLISSGAYNPLDRIKKIYDVTQSLELINWFCQLADGHFVRNTKAADLESADMVSALQRFIKEFSETLNMISQSYSDDQSISSKEANRIRKEWEDLKRIGEGFVQACEEGVFNEEQDS